MLFRSLLFLSLDLIATISARDYVSEGWRRFVPGSGFVASLDRVEASKNSQRALIASFKAIDPGHVKTLRDANGDEWAVMWLTDMEHVLERANMKIGGWPLAQDAWKPKVFK